MASKAINYLIFALFPVVGGGFAGYYISRNSMRLGEAVKLCLLGGLISLFSAAVFLLQIGYIEFLSSYSLAFLVVSLLSPFIGLFLSEIGGNSVSVNYSEDAVELKILIKKKYESFEPEQLFSEIYSSAIRKVKNPLYFDRLKDLKGCSPLKVKASSSFMTLRRDCGQIKIEIIIGDQNTKMKVAIPY